MGNCIAANESSNSENLKIAERIVEITWSEYDKDGNGVLDMTEVRNYVHANVQQMVKKGLMIDNEVPNDDKLMDLIKTYDDNGDGNISKEEMKAFILKTLTVGWVPKNQK